MHIIYTSSNASLAVITLYLLYAVEKSLAHINRASGSGLQRKAMEGINECRQDTTWQIAYFVQAKVTPAYFAH